MRCLLDETYKPNPTICYRRINAMLLIILVPFASCIAGGVAGIIGAIFLGQINDPFMLVMMGLVFGGYQSFILGIILLFLTRRFSDNKRMYSFIFTGAIFGIFTPILVFNSIVAWDDLFLMCILGAVCGIVAALIFMLITGLAFSKPIKPAHNQI